MYHERIWDDFKLHIVFVIRSYTYNNLSSSNCKQHRFEEHPEDFEGGGDRVVFQLPAEVCPVLAGYERECDDGQWSWISEMFSRY